MNPIPIHIVWVSNTNLYSLESRLEMICGDPRGPFASHLVGYKTL